jgi:hypothetical protein
MGRPRNIAKYKCRQERRTMLRQQSLGKRLRRARLAAASGYSTDHLTALIRKGTLPNAGRKHAPRIRRGDLPRKPRRSQSGSALPHTDLDAIARRIISGRIPR